MLTNKILCFLPPVRCISSLAHKGIMLSARNFDADGCCCRRRRCCQHVPAVKYYIETSVFIRAKTIKTKNNRPVASLSHRHPTGEVLRVHFYLAPKYLIGAFVSGSPPRDGFVCCAATCVPAVHVSTM